MLLPWAYSWNAWNIELNRSHCHSAQIDLIRVQLHLVLARCRKSNAHQINRHIDWLRLRLNCSANFHLAKQLFVLEVDYPHLKFVLALGICQFRINSTVSRSRKNNRIYVIENSYERLLFGLLIDDDLIANQHRKQGWDTRLPPVPPWLTVTEAQRQSCIIFDAIWDSLVCRISLSISMGNTLERFGAKSDTCKIVTKCGSFRD